MLGNCPGGSFATNNCLTCLLNCWIAELLIMNLKKRVTAFFTSLICCGLKSKWKMIAENLSYTFDHVVDTISFFYVPFVQMAGYVTWNGELSEEELFNATSFYYNEFGEFTKKLDCGGLNVLTDNICRWVFFSYIIFNSVKNFTCRKLSQILKLIRSDGWPPWLMFSTLKVLIFASTNFRENLFSINSTNFNIPYTKLIIGGFIFFYVEIVSLKIAYEYMR